MLRGSHTHSHSITWNTYLDAKVNIGDDRNRKFAAFRQCVSIIPQARHAATRTIAAGGGQFLDLTTAVLCVWQVRLAVNNKLPENGRTSPTAQADAAVRRR